MAEDVNRRNFMIRTISVVFVFIGGVLLAALGGFGIVPVLKKRAPEWSDAGSIVDLMPDQPQERRFFEVVKSGWQSQKQERSVWLVKKSDGTVTAYSANCPHLGCGYRWIAERNRFECPCHGSVFDVNGKVLSGPAPRPLDVMPVRIVNERLMVQYKVFQLGTAKMIEA